MEISDLFPSKGRKTPSTNYSFLSSPALSPSSKSKFTLCDFSFIEYGEKLTQNPQPNVKIIEKYFETNKKVRDTNKRCVDILIHENVVKDKICVVKQKISERKEKYFETKNQFFDNKSFLISVQKLEKENEKNNKELKNIIEKYFYGLNKIHEANQILKKILKKMKDLEQFNVIHKDNCAKLSVLQENQARIVNFQQSFIAEQESFGDKKKNFNENKQKILDLFQIIEQKIENNKKSGEYLLNFDIANKFLSNDILDMQNLLEKKQKLNEEKRNKLKCSKIKLKDRCYAKELSNLKIFHDDLQKRKKKDILKLSLELNEREKRISNTEAQMHEKETSLITEFQILKSISS